MCQHYAAALGDEKTYKSLLEAYIYNSRQFASTIWPCECKPPCKRPTKAQLIALNARLKKDMGTYRKKQLKRIGKLGSFDKFIFPIIKNMTWPAGKNKDVCQCGAVNDTGWKACRVCRRPAPVDPLDSRQFVAVQPMYTDFKSK
jgi:hypothetical protein